MSILVSFLFAPYHPRAGADQRIFFLITVIIRSRTWCRSIKFSKLFCSSLSLPTDAGSIWTKQPAGFQSKVMPNLSIIGFIADEDNPSRARMAFAFARGSETIKSNQLRLFERILLASERGKVDQSSACACLKSKVRCRIMIRVTTTLHLVT